MRDGRGAGRSWPLAPGAGSSARDMARGPGPLGRPRPDTVAMPKRGKRLKFRAHDACSGRGGSGVRTLQDLGLAAGRGLDRRDRALLCRKGRAAGLGSRSEEVWVGKTLEKRPLPGGLVLCFSDRGGLCQLGSGSREVWTGQESRRQRCSAGR